MLTWVQRVAQQHHSLLQGMAAAACGPVAHPYVGRVCQLSVRMYGMKQAGNVHPLSDVVDHVDTYNSN